MKLITNEYTVLISQNGGEDIQIRPNIEFDPFEVSGGEYKVSSYARVLNAETKEVVLMLNSGEVVSGVGTVEKPKPKAKPKAEPTLLEEVEG